MPLTATATYLDEHIFAPARLVRADIAHNPLPAPLRPDADLTMLDISEYFSDTGGGVRTYLVQKARFFERRPDLRQVMLVPGSHDSITQGTGVRCYRLQGPAIPFNRNYRFMLATRSTARIVAHERPDVIEIGSAYYAPWMVAKARRRFNAPAVWFYHAHLPRIVAPGGAAHGPLIRALSHGVGEYVRRISNMVDTTIVASEFTERDLHALGVERVARVALGVDLERFHSRRRAWAAETRRAHGLPVEGPIVMFVGRIAREKRLDVALAAWPEIHRRTGATLVLVGDGPLTGRFRARDLPGVAFVRYQRSGDVVADLHAAADLYLAAGPAETFGLAGLEALASGTPVLSVDRGGVMELVQRSGAGRVYPEGDSEALASEAVSLLTGGDLALLGERGRAYAVAHHSWDSVFERLLQVYRNVRR